MKFWARRAGQDANRVKRDAAVGGYVRLKTNPNVIRGPDSVLRRLSVIHVNAHDKASKDSRELCDLLLSQVSQQVTETGRHEAIKCCSVVAVLFGIGQRAGSACSHPNASLCGSSDRHQEGARTIPVAVRG